MSRLAAAPASLAQLYASFAACESTHVSVLGARIRPVTTKNTVTSRAVALAAIAALQGRSRRRARRRLRLRHRRRDAHRRRADGGAQWTAHQVARDTLEAMLTRRGATRLAAAPAYKLPFPVTGAASAKKLAATLEDGVTRAYPLGVVAVDGPGAAPSAPRRCRPRRTAPSPGAAARSPSPECPPETRRLTAGVPGRWTFGHIRRVPKRPSSSSSPRTRPSAVSTQVPYVAIVGYVQITMTAERDRVNDERGNCG